MPRVEQPRSPLTGEILTDETLALAAQEHGINLAETSVGRMFDGGAEKLAAIKQRRQASLKRKAIGESIEEFLQEVKVDGALDWVTKSYLMDQMDFSEDEILSAVGKGLLHPMTPQEIKDAEEEVGYDVDSENGIWRIAAKKADKYGPPVSVEEITEEDFQAYEDVRSGRQTNMFDVRNIEALSGLDRGMIMSIMKNYDSLRSKYPNVRSASLRKKAGITVGSKPFSAINAGSEGLVITGAGGDPQQWINGITEMLIDEGILKGLAPEDWISEAFTLSDNVEGKNGRTDLVLVFKDGDALDIGKMAMWRLKFGGALWLSDFVDNHAGDYKSSISGGSGVETEGSLKRKAEPKIETQDDEKKDGSYASRRRSKR